MIDGKSWKGYTVRAMPALLLVSCVVLAIASVLAWDATAASELSAWVPTAAGLELAVPVGLIAFVCLRVVSRRTIRRFSVMPLQLTSGVLLVMIAVALFVFATHLRAYSGEGAGLPGIDKHEDSVFSLAGVTAVTVFAILTVTGVSCVYCQAITAEDPSKWDKQAGEPDATGEILRSLPH